jgi:hypothetical protein
MSEILPTSAPAETASESANEQVEQQEQELGQETAAPAASTEPTKEEIKELKKRLKIKVDGEEFEEEIDLADEEGLKRHLQMSKVAQKRMQEFSSLRKEVEDFVGAMKDPKQARAIMRELGLNERELAELIINDAIEESKKTPEQLAMEKIEQEKEKLRKELDAIKKEKEESELRAKQERFEKELENEMITAIDKAGVPVSPYMIKRTADFMSLALENNIKLSPAEILPLVISEVKGDIKKLVADMPDEVLEEYLTKDRLSNYRKKAIAKAKEVAQAVGQSQVKATGQSELKTKEEKAAKDEPKKMSVRDWLKS